MTAVPQPPAEQRGDVAAWLDRLEELRAAATPGPWRHDPRIAGVGVIHGSNGTPAVWTNGGIKNAALVVAAVNNLPQLVAAIRGVLALADEMADASKLPTVGDFDRGVGAHQRDAADRLRSAVAAALTDGTAR